MAANEAAVIAGWISVDEAAARTGLSRRAIEGRIERGTIESRVEGRRRLVSLVSLFERGLIPMSPGETVKELLDRLEEANRRIGELEAKLRDRD